MYSLDTSAFYNDAESRIGNKIFKSRIHKSKVKKHYKDNKDKEVQKRLNSHYKFINQRVSKLKKKLEDLLSENEDVRILNEDHLKESHKISLFESNLTRTLGIETNTLTEELFVVRTYYFRVLKDLIKDGFIYNGEKYIYFSSSAGQIRTKKGVWIRKSSWETHQKTLTCGLTVDEINKKGGSNINKYLAYLALTNSASDEMKRFNIDQTIVVDDLETSVNAMVDYIDRDTYDITKGKKMDIPIEHTDGCGMILPSSSKKSFMIRLPFVKGLLVPFDFRDFIKQEGGSHIVKDIYGRYVDILKEDIRIIFTKSQFKMHKYYDGWSEYQEKFKKYNCRASMLNEEEDIFSEAKINYQMLQTLPSLTDEELESITESVNHDIREIGSDKETMLKLLGATKENENKNYFQEALMVYPELLNDNHSRKVIKDVKKSLVKKARSGRINIDSKYTFVSPDLYAFCEYLFKGIKKPKGLLSDGEVYFGQYGEIDLDILRSPHLYKEHAVRRNVKSDSVKRWFCTNNIYVSVHDPISKILQLDWDGDKLLVVADKVIVNAAKREMQDIRPLYYEMAKAEPSEINYENIYNGLIPAFKANIGVISNEITKIWNAKEPDLDVVKWKTMENNFTIDYAKTLFMPKRPKKIDKRMKENIKGKMPFFFQYVKDKDESLVEAKNNSVVNRLSDIVENKPIQFKKIAGRFNFWLLTNKKKECVDQDVIKKYIHLTQSKGFIVRNMLGKTKNEQFNHFNSYLRQQLLEVNDDINQVVNSLIHYLYKESHTRSRVQLWDSFGDILVRNLKSNLKNTKQCEVCGNRFEYKNNKSKYCKKCGKTIDREKARARMRIVRNRKSQTP